jgi:hypothetical protein
MGRPRRFVESGREAAGVQATGTGMPQEVGMTLTR